MTSGPLNDGEMRRSAAKPLALKKLRIPHLVFLAGILLTIFASYFVYETVNARNREHFHTAVAETDAEIHTRIEAYVALLRGGGGLYSVNKWVEPEQFHLFVQRLRLKEFYPGVQGLGFSPRLTPENQGELLARIRKTNPVFRVTPAPNQIEAFPIVLLEPQDERNRAAIGFNMFSEPIRRAAMIRARDEGLPSATGKITLVQEIDHEKQPGFIIYTPIYATGGVPETLEERRQTIEGFIYAPLRAKDFLEAVAVAERVRKIGFEIYDGEQLEPENLIFQTDPSLKENRTSPNLERISTITVAGQPWTIRFYSLDPSNSVRWLFPLIPAVGLLLSFILFYLTEAEARARNNSEEALKRLQDSQAALKASEELHRTVTQTASDGIIVSDELGNIQTVNSAGEQILGYPLNELTGQPLTVIMPERFRERHRKGFEQFIQTGKRTIGWSALQIPGRRKNGEEVPLEISYGSFRRDNKLFVTGIFRDISERLKAEQAVRASEHQLQTIADALPVLIGAVDRDLRYRFNNKSYESWVGLNSANLKGRSMRDVLGEDAFNDAYPYLQRGLSGEHVNFEKSMTYPNRLSRHVHASIIPEKNQQGEVIGLFLLMMDISDRKRQEDAARFISDVGRKFSETLTYESTLHAIVEHAVPTLAEWCAVDLLTADGNLERIESSHINPSRRELGREISSRYPPRANRFSKKTIEAGESVFLPQVDENFLHEVAQDEQHMNILREAGIKSIISVPMRGRRRIYGAITFATTGSGRTYTEFDVHVAAEVASRAGLAIENALLYQEAQLEIEERRVIEQALRESEERFRIMVEQARDYAIFMLDHEGNISSWNSGAERILGYTELEILGQHSALLFTPEDRAEGIPELEIETSKKTGRALDERWHLRKDGSRFFCSGYMFSLRDEQGNLRGFTKIMRDITERKRWEEDIQRLNQELESRVEQRTAALRDSYDQMETFTYTVAHDLRAPLRAMLGFSQAILEENQQILDPTSRDFLQRIIRASHRMDSLIQDLLAYSHIARTDLKFEVIGLQSVINDVMNGITDELQMKHIKFIADGIFPSVNGHRTTLRTVVSNLVNNAVKFSSRKDSPTVELRAETKEYEGEPFVRLWVIDNGIGIAPGHHERIFRVFERLHGQDSYAGTGIGLAIVKKGVERMRGRVGVESELNEGSRFWIELPAAHSI